MIKNTFISIILITILSLIYNEVGKMKIESQKQITQTKKKEE